MPHWKATLAYDGTPYHGWQIQPNLPTVQGTLAQAIYRITGETFLPQGSGRTDAGVHALAQVATFSLTVPIPAANLHRALNRALPPSIRVLALAPVAQNFHARHSALRKTYEYRIFPGGLSSNHARICSPMLAPYVWACPYPLDLVVLNQAAAYILGAHDFTSFAAADPDLATRNTSQEDNERADIDAVAEADLVRDMVRENPAEEKVVVSTGDDASAAAVEKPASLPPLSPSSAATTRTIFHSSWHPQDDLLLYRVTCSGFLHHMVRNLVGTFVEAGSSRISPDTIPAILRARNRSAAGPTAPARGLFLVDVEY